MFDFDEIEQVDPELFPGDWIKVRSLDVQGLVMSYSGEDGFYKLHVPGHGEDRRQRSDLEKLGDREKTASLIRCLLAVSAESPSWVAEVRRMHAECVSRSFFQQRANALCYPFEHVYAAHEATEEWLHKMATHFAPLDEEIADLWGRSAAISQMLTFQPSTSDGAPSPSSPSTGGSRQEKKRWVAVTPCGNICDRLCAMISARMLAADLGRELAVDWRPCAECGYGLEEIVLLEHAWFYLLTPELARQDTSLHWASRVNSLWHGVLERSGHGEEVCQAVLSDFNECHKKAFRKRLAYSVDAASSKWRELPRLQGYSFEGLPDFLRVDCICASASGWFYPPRPCDEAAAVEERSAWLRGIKLPPRLVQNFDSGLWKLQPGTVCVHADRGGDGRGAERSPDRLFIEQMDARLAKMDGEKGGFLLVTDDALLMEALKERYGERLSALPERAADRGTLEEADRTIVELLFLAQGEEILGSYGSALSGFAPLVHSNELVVLDTEAEGGCFRASDGWAVDVAERATLRREVHVAVKDPSETMGFHLCGSWDGWAGLLKFASPTHEQPAYVARVKVRQPPEVEEFYVVKDSDLTQRYYPRLCGSSVMGPDGTEGAYWRVRTPAGCEWLEVSWDPGGGRCLAWRLLGPKGKELQEEPEPPLPQGELEGPFFLVGSWNNWREFVEMEPVQMDIYHGYKTTHYALVPLRQPAQDEEFQVALGRSWERRFYPARGSSAILGPAHPASGSNWRVLPAAGSRLLGVNWDPQGARSLRCECFEARGGPPSSIAPLGQFYLAGSWDNWTGFVHLRPEATSNPHCRARIRAKQTPVALQFQVVVDRDWHQRFWRSKKVPAEILGPGNVEGLGWIANVPAGSRWIEVTWDPTGARSLRWSLVGEPNGASQLQHIADANVRVAESMRLAEEREACAQQPQPSLRAGLGDVDLCVSQIYRYHCDGVDDSGWGCVYRNTQTIMEALGHDAPPLAEITRAMGTGDAWLRQPGAQCAWVEPHDVAEYLKEQASNCKTTRLLWVAGKEPLDVKEGQTQALMFCKDGTEAWYEVLDKPADVLPESAEAKQHCLRVREVLVQHLLRARTPVLLDDKEAAFLVAGFRWSDDRGPEYRILDPHYGQTYPHQNSRPPFNRALGPNQFGGDEAKDQWVTARWVEEGRGILNGYTPNPSWMMLLVN